MRYKLLGKSGLRVSELCLGTMTFGEEFGWGASKEESRKMFDVYVRAGGNFLDTANFYTRGTSERYVGEFIQAERDRFVLATKYTLNARPDDPNSGGNHRKNLVQSLEASLKRLNTDRVDLYWVHAWDKLTPIEEVMRALDDQVLLGKILYVGVSNFPAWIVAQANTMALFRGWSEFVALQIQYSLIERTSEREYVPMAKAFDLAVTAWSPLGGGVLTGKYNRKEDGLQRYTESHPRRPDFVNDRNLAVAQAVVDIAGDIGRTASQVALNWIRQKKSEGVFIPIIGGRTAGQIQDNLGCLEFELSSEHLAKLEEVSRIQLGYPHDYLELPFIKGLTHGRTFELVDNHRK
jgi:aryl-alcohol dehydrogenase-like predicted oxidoreductase